MANAGLSNVPIGLDCEHCGQPITVSYIAHGSDREALISEPMQHLVAGATRYAIEHGQSPPLCSACCPPHAGHDKIARVRARAGLKS